jgi:hypothetical protein
VKILSPASEFKGCLVPRHNLPRHSFVAAIKENVAVWLRIKIRLSPKFRIKIRLPPDKSFFHQSFNGRNKRQRAAPAA